MFEDLKSEAKSLYEKKDFAKALEIYEQLKEIDKDKFEKQCLFNYMWCLYRVKINTQDAFEDNNIVSTKEMIKYIMQHQKNKDLLYQFVVLRTLKYLKKKPNFEAETINTWLDKLDPEYLSEEVHEYEHDGKQTIYSSNKEEWYALKTKALEKLERYTECINYSSEALNKFKELHNGNDVWFKRRIAISKSKLGEPHEAVGMLTEILKKKKDWFIYKDIADIHASIDNKNDALDHYVKAILAPGEDDKKINLFWDAGNLFNLLCKYDEEILLKCYSIKLRLDNEWKLSSEEKTYWDKNKDYIDGNEISHIRKCVINTIRGYRWKDSDKLEGTISKILPNNKAGFIRANSGSYYFRTNDIQGRRNSIKEGMRVNFFLEKGFDIKKGQETDNAVNVTIIE